MELKVKKEHEKSKLPTKSYEHAAGFDLYSVEDVSIWPGELATISTGISFEIPIGYVGLIWPRSGMAVKKTSDIYAGVIDSDFRGIVKACLYNGKLSRHAAWTFDDELPEEDRVIVIRSGDKIAQILIQEVPHFTITEVKDLSESIRGDKGFGSTKNG